MEILHFIYNKKTIDFEFNKQTDLMVNATQMAKIFGKRIENFTRMETTQNFITECLKNANQRFLSIENEQDLIDSKQKSGTWMHRILALKFAAWLNPAFELWIFITIDKIINQEFQEQRSALLDKIKAQKQKETKKQDLILKYPELQEYFDLDEKEHEAHNRRVKAIKDQIKQLNLEFNFD